MSESIDLIKQWIIKGDHDLGTANGKPNTAKPLFMKMSVRFDQMPDDFMAAFTND